MRSERNRVVALALKLSGKDAEDVALGIGYSFDSVKRWARGAVDLTFKACLEVCRYCEQDYQKLLNKVSSGWDDEH